MVTPHAAALMSLWNDTCTIIVKEELTDPITKITSFDETVLFDNLPCKLSFKLPFGRQNLTKQGNVADVTQLVKLFLPPEIHVPPGSRITVTHRGRVTEYTQSGAAEIYSSHQEISLTLFDKWA